MQTARKRIRRDYAPLNVAVSLVCGSSGSPVLQVFDGRFNTYEPDRTATPTILLPVIHADASDGSITTPVTNKDLADIKWFVNGVDITTASDWTGKYTIMGGTGEERGALYIERNVQPDETFTFYFEGSIFDKRLGVTVKVHSDELPMGTIDKSLNGFSLCTDAAESMVYNPFIDGLLMYDYKVAQGETEASSAARAAAKDENAYERTVNIYLFEGAKLYGGKDVALSLNRVAGISDGVETLEPLSADDENEIVEFVSALNGKGELQSHVTMDLRMVESGTYVVLAKYGDREVARTQFGVSRLYPAYMVDVVNGADLAHDASEHYNEVQVSSGGRIVDYPAAVLDIVWKTDSVTKTEVIHNEGHCATIDLAKAGVGVTYEDDWMDVYVDVQQRAPYAIATAVDSNGDEVVLTDENGNTLIYC